MERLLDILDISENFKLGVKGIIGKVISLLLECWFVLFLISRIFDGLYAFSGYDNGVKNVFNNTFDNIKIMIFDNISSTVYLAIITLLIVITSQYIWNRIKYWWYN